MSESRSEAEWARSNDISVSASVHLVLVHRSNDISVSASVHLVLVHR